MQVADLGALSADASSRLKQVYEQASMVVVKFYQKSEIAVQKVKAISPYGLRALAYVIHSTRLSKQEKRTLIRLIAIVDEFAGGDPKLMRDIIGIARIMEMNSTKSYPPMSIREGLKKYFEEREKLSQERDVIISVETEINIVSFEYLSVSKDEAMQKAEASGLVEPQGTFA